MGAILAAAIRAGTPILYATLGEIVTERAGVMNLGIEGMMLVGALSSFASYYRLVEAYGANPLFLVAGVIIGMIAAAALAALHAFLTITMRANQVVSGLALTIFGIGITNFIGASYVGKPAVGFDEIPIPLLSGIRMIGPGLFNQNALVYLSYLLIFVLWVYIFKTRPGLDLRSVGENPRAADIMGINVTGVRYFYVILGGLLCGLGGAYLSLAYTPGWTPEMAAGRGWIAIALVIFSRWNPLQAALGAYLFGGISAIQMRIQAAGAHIPANLLMMLPYIVTIIVLILSPAGRRAGLSPRALGLPYIREERE